MFHFFKLRLHWVVVFIFFLFLFFFYFLLLLLIKKKKIKLRDWLNAAEMNFFLIFILDSIPSD